jgi:hypothetical protein
MTVARMAQGTGVLSDQDLRTVQGSGLDAAMADAIGYLNGGGQLSARQRYALSNILITRMGALDAAQWSVHDEAVAFAQSHGIDPASLGYREPRVPRPGGGGGSGAGGGAPDASELTDEQLEAIARGER